MVQLFVRALNSRSCCFDVNPETDTVRALKLHIQEIEGVPVQHQGLVYEGRQLDDDQTLAHYGAGANSTMHLVLRLRGGKGGFGALLRGQGRDGKITTNFDACRDLQGRRIRHATAEQKLAEWNDSAKERELEKVALQHIKEQEKQQRREAANKVDVEEVQAAQQDAIKRTQAAVKDALAAAAPSTSGAAGKQGPGQPGAAVGAKRKGPEGAGAGAAGSSNGAVVAKKPKMLAALEDLGSDISSDDEDEDA